MENIEAVLMFLLVSNIPIIIALIAYAINGSKVYKIIFDSVFGGIFIAIY